MSLSDKRDIQFGWQGEEHPMYWEKDVKNSIKRLKDNKRFNQSGGELKDELGLNDAKIIMKIQLMLIEILLDIDKIFGRKLT